MGWGNCGADEDGRPIGYYFTATCDKEGCEAKIDRGLAYACGNMHGFADGGCDKYFCGDHLFYGAPVQMCQGCQGEHGKLSVKECGGTDETPWCVIHEDMQTEHEELGWGECTDEGCEYHDEMYYAELDKGGGEMVTFQGEEKGL